MATPSQASQFVQTLSQAQIEDLLRNLAARVDAQGNLEPGAYELLACIATNTARHATTPRVYRMTSTGAFTARRIIKGYTGDRIRIYDIRIYGAGASTFSFTDETGTTIIPSIRITAAAQVRLNSYRGMSLPAGKSVFIAQTGAVAADILISAAC